MERITPTVYSQINNEVYKSDGDIWWKPDTVLHLLKTSVNPWRVGFAQRIINELNIDPHGKTALEVGSGGGILTEEIHKMGFKTSGIDPAEESVNTARRHAESEGFDIHYDLGSGEDIPYSD